MKTRNIKWAWLALAAAMASGIAYAQSSAFVIEEDGGSRVMFTSDAPLETINGVTSHVMGQFQVDPGNLAASRGTVEVRVATIHTGIDLRDEHLRSDTWLDAARFPTAKFELTGVSGAASLAPGRETRVNLTGRFTLHGHTHDVRAQGRVTWIADAAGAGTNQIRVRARFAVRLTDYGVSVPSLVELKVSNEIAVEVSLRGSAH